MATDISALELPRRPSFELVFRPSVELISMIRRFVSEFFTQVVENEDAAGRLALATHELVENAAKYTTAGATTLHVELDRDSGTVHVRTRNRTDAARIADVTRCFAESAATLDAHAFHNEVIRRSAVDRQVGLGLARVRAEGEMTLELVVVDDVVEISARGLIVSAKA